MNYTLVIKHIQTILNQCGDPVNLIQTGQKTICDTGDMSIEINRACIMRQNKYYAVPPPSPFYSHDPKDKYSIKRIRISQRLAEDYSKNLPLTDDEMKSIICEKTDLFSFY